MSWQGWIYLIIVISVLFIGLILPQNMIIHLIVGGVFLFLFMDMIMATYNSMDERGRKHYSISMRNAAWGMLITIILSSMVLSYIHMEGSLNILIIATALIGGLIGLITRYKLEKEN